MLIIASSEATSTSETKSLADLFFIVSWSISSAARNIIEPAWRAALTAVLSIGCIDLPFI